MTTTKPKPPRGFAAMDADRVREIASLGGKSVPADKRSFAQDRKLAARAGAKGGKATCAAWAAGVEAGGSK